MTDVIEFHLSTSIGEITGLQKFQDTEKGLVLAIHGWLDNAASFVPLMTADTKFNWLAIDLPGHGHSQHKSRGAHYHFIDWVSDLLEIIKAVQTAPQFAAVNTSDIHLVGHSLGGMISTVFASLYPEYIKQLVTIDAAGLITEAEEFDQQGLRAALDSRLAAACINRRVLPSKSQAYRARKKAGTISDLAVQLLVDRNLSQVESGYCWHTDPRLKTFSPIRISERLAHRIVRGISVPTNLIIAEDGLTTVKSNLKLYLQDYQSCGVHNVAGGHHCHMEHPQQILKVLEALI